jgi:hypothetical protein
MKPIAYFIRTKVIAAAGGPSGDHSLELYSYGTVAAWGANHYGQAGDNTTADRHVPVAVNTTTEVSVLSNKMVVAIAAGDDDSLALFADGTVAAWGSDGAGQLGDNTTIQRILPTAVNTTPFAASQRFSRVASSSDALHTLALVAAAPGACESALTAAQTLTNGSFQFTFTNTPGAFFGVLAATNPTLLPSDWKPLDGLTEITPGQFQFTDAQVTKNPRRFYRVRSP